MKRELHLAVPTTTLIVASKNDPLFVAVFKSTGKHGNKLVLPGGRVKIGKDNWLQTGLIEANEELAIKNLTDIKFFCICSNPDRDIRNVTLEKFLDGQQKPDDFPTSIDIVGHYTFDVVLTAVTGDELLADASEGKEAQFLDLRKFDPNEFALDHGQLLVAYVEYLKSGVLPALDKF